MLAREADRGLGELDPVLGAHGRDPTCALDDRHWRRRVVERRAGRRRRGGEESGIEHAGGDDGDSTLRAERKQPRRRPLVEERVAPGDEDDVDVALGGEPDRGVGVIHADADRA